MKKLPALLVLAASGAALASTNFLDDLIPENTGNGRQMKKVVITGDYVSASRATGELVATGNVNAVSGVYRFHSDRISHTADGSYELGGETSMTTCTNDVDHLHWSLTTKSPFESVDNGSFRYVENKSVTVRNAWLRYHDVPVAWVPFWYFPLNTDYGWRFTPGYTSRWGGFILSGYVYDIVNEGREGVPSLGGSTYADYRTRNGFGLGQTIRWGLNDFGKGKVKLYRAWDEDYDRYADHLYGSKHHYSHWGSEVERNRYRVMIEHEADFTERDSFRARAMYLSDSHLLNDFFRREHRDESIPSNEAWYEHRELSWAGGASVSGPVNDFYGGTARLPEAWFDVSPQPVFDLPFNYESQTRAGYLNRDFAKHELSEDTMFRYNPYIGHNGRGADYQAFRADTFHRISAPFKLWDVLAVNPRTSYRGTYWSDSGDASSDYVKASGDGMYRHVFEAGATAAARASAWLGERWRHTFEPYVDYSFQRVDLSSNGRKRYYVFDAYDRSMDWLDQFGFEGRGLPYNWHGVRPGVRNLLQNLDANDNLREYLDLDLYAAIPFETMDYVKDRESALYGYPDDDEDGHYNPSGDRQVVPGTRIRYKPTKDVTFLTRTEYDCQNSSVAYADLSFLHRLSDSFSYYFGYSGRDHRVWDYLPSDYRRWNYEYANIVRFGFRHNVCDHFAWSPYIRHDCRLDETEEVGAWFDILTDCLGYRLLFCHETSYRRVDGSKNDSDNRVVFYVYLRALGPGSMLDMLRF